MDGLEDDLRVLSVRMETKGVGQEGMENKDVLEAARAQTGL
jgi:hypothetical protein